MQFEWDEEKRKINIKKHGVDFRDLVSVFETPHLTYLSPKTEEKRYVAVGKLRPSDRRPGEWYGPLVAVVYTQRDGSYRIISARRAQEHERRAYEILFG